MVSNLWSFIDDGTSHEYEKWFSFASRSHSVCQLTIERTLNKNKMNAEGIAKHGKIALFSALGKPEITESLL